MVVPLRSQVRLRLSRLSVQHGRSASSHRPALTLARCSVAAHCALLRVLATPALRASDVRKLTRGAPCFTGLIGGYCTLNSQWSSCCALRLAVLPCSLGLLRPVSRTARGLRAPHWLRRLFRPHWTSASPVSRTARGEAPSPLGLLRPVSATGGGLRAPLSRLHRQHSSIQHGRTTPSHRPALTLARCSAPADFASLRVLGAPAASRPPTLASSLVALPASLGSSYRPALR